MLYKVLDGLKQTSMIMRSNLVQSDVRLSCSRIGVYQNLGHRYRDLYIYLNLHPNIDFSHAISAFRLILIAIELTCEAVLKPYTLRQKTDPYIRHSAVYHQEPHTKAISARNPRAYDTHHSLSSCSAAGVPLKFPIRSLWDELTPQTMPLIRPSQARSLRCLRKTTTTAAASRNLTVSARRAAGDSHGSHYDPPSGWLWGIPPGQEYKKEGWETIFYWMFCGGCVAAAVGYAFKPDTR